MQCNSRENENIAIPEFERALVEQLLYYMKEAIEEFENDRIPSSSLAGGIRVGGNNES